MAFAKHTFVRAAALSAALLASFAALPTPALRADGIGDQIKAMQDLDAAGDEGKCIAKMQELKDSVGDSRVMKAIKDMIGSKSDKIACAAVKMIAGLKTKDAEFLKWICGKIDDKDIYKAKDKGGNPDLVCAFLDAVVAYKFDKPSQPTIKAALPKFFDVVKRHMGDNSEFTTRAIRAYGCVRDKAVMEQLLDWGEQIESRSGKGGGGGGSKKGASTETRDNESKAKKVILETIADITEKEGVDIPTWRKWWTENGKTFVFPEAGDPATAGAPAAAAAVDPAAAEFKDPTYGFSLKKPAGDDWFWAKADYTADETPRVMLKYQPKSGEIARAYVLVHSMKKPPADIKGMVKWALEDPKGPYVTQLEPADAKHAPKAEERPSGWTVIIGKGNGLAQRVGFGSQERRFYFAQMGTSILYVDAVIRLGAEEEVSKAFWACLDSITLPPAKK
jgi:hypothetical protein